MPKEQLVAGAVGDNISGWLSPPPTLHEFDPVGLSTLERGEVVTFALTQTSGRRLTTSLCVDDVLGSYAYANILAAEQIDPGSSTYRTRRGPSLSVARLPLDGVINNSPYPLDLTPISDRLTKPRRTQAAMEAAEWRPLSLQFDEITVTNRSKGAVYPDTASLQQLTHLNS